MQLPERRQAIILDCLRFEPEQARRFARVRRKNPVFAPARRRRQQIKCVRIEHQRTFRVQYAIEYRASPRVAARGRVPRLSGPHAQSVVAVTAGPQPHDT